jgi:Tfp pilus assembly protein FimT
MPKQSGITLTELMIVLAFAAAIVVSTVTLSIPWLAREALHNATHELQSTLQLNRMEAVNRNRPCRFVLNTASRQLQVWDGMGTTATTDDVLLHTSSLSSAISFVRPDTGPAVTLTDLGGASYQTVFDSDGTVDSGDGEIVVFGGGQYNRLTLYVAGGIRIEHWNGAGWGS